MDFQLFEKPSFLDYLRAGWSISVVGAIDYSTSNGDLHDIGINKNQYQQAIFDVGSVIEPYDYDRSFPFYGFGGIPGHMRASRVSHCFPINGNIANPEI